MNSGFSHVQTENLVKESTDAAVEVFEDNNLFGSAIPEILGIVSIISIGKNFMNWAEGNTNVETALKMIIEAKKTGCDVIKFQDHIRDKEMIKFAHHLIEEGKVSIRNII